MNMVRVVLDVDKSPPLAGEDPGRVTPVKEGAVFARIPRGMASGASAVAIVAPLGGGRWVSIEMSMSNFECAAAAFRGAEQRDEEKRVAEGN